MGASLLVKPKIVGSSDKSYIVTDPPDILKPYGSEWRFVNTTFPAVNLYFNTRNANKMTGTFTVAGETCSRSVYPLGYTHQSKVFLTFPAKIRMIGILTEMPEAPFPSGYGCSGVIENGSWARMWYQFKPYSNDASDLIDTSKYTFKVFNVASKNADLVCCYEHYNNMGSGEDLDNHGSINFAIRITQTQMIGMIGVYYYNGSDPASFTRNIPAQNIYFWYLPA